MASGSLFSQLDMGKRSLMAQQAGMNTVGHNIANIGNENYSRQKVELEPQHPLHSRFGSGVDLKGVDRVADRFLNQRLIGEQSREGQISARESGLRRIENLMNDAEGFGLREALNQFWSAWGGVANNPEAELYRTDLINASNTLARRINGLGTDFQTLRKELNGRISERVNRVNEMTGQLATLNAKVQQAERGAGEANDLKDQREGIVRELSKLIQVEWFEDEHKAIHVNVGAGFPLVIGRRANPLEASFKSGEAGYYSLRGLDAKGISRDLTGEVKSGEIPELLALRDETIVKFADKLDSLASSLALEVNRLHATGTGLNSSFTTVRSSFALKADAVGRPLPFLRSGNFRLHLVDDKNQVLESYEIGVKPGQDTLPDIVKRINDTVGDPNLLTAKLDSDGSMVLEAKAGKRFILGDDDTDLAVLMGFNNFFESLHGAHDFRVSERLLKNPSAVSTGKGLLPGDNTVALAIHELQHQPTMDGKAITFDEYYNGMMAELGLMINRTQNDKRNQDLIVDQFKKLRDEVSSVNMDEEVADMVQYQRGFDAAAKFIATVDDMTKTVIQM